MNNNINSKAPQVYNPWSVKENLPKISPLFLVWTVLFSLACSLYPFLAPLFPAYAPVVMCVLGIASALAFYRSVPSKLLFVIPTAALAFFLVSPFAAAYLTALVIPVALGSVALAVCAKKSPRLSVFFLLLPAASFGIAYLLSNSISLSIISLIIYPAIILLAFAFANDSPRVSSICHGSIGFAIAATTLIGVVIFRKYGEFSSDTLEIAINDLQTLCINRTHKFLIESEELLRPLYESAKITSYTEFINVEQLVPAVFAYIPACAIILCNILGFLAHSGASSTLDALYKGNKNKLRTLKSSKFVMSAISAVIFLVAGLVQFIASCAGAYDISLITETIFLMLLPGFALSGLGSFVGKVMISKSKNKVAVFALAIIFALCLFFPALTLLALSGAFDTISYHLFLEKIKRPKDFK